MDIYLEYIYIYQFEHSCPQILLSPMKNLLAILPTAAILHVVFMSQFPVNLYSRLKLVKPPEPAAVTVETPTLTESCYTYSNFTANNICCKMKKYSGSDILKCVTELSMEQILRHR